MFVNLCNIRGYSGYAKAVRELVFAMAKEYPACTMDFNQMGYLPDRIYPLLLGILRNFLFRITLLDNFYLKGNTLMKNKKIPLEKAMETAKEVFLENNIAFEIKNNGYHFVIRTENNRYDFWPTSGKFMVNSSGKSVQGGLTKLVSEIIKSRKSFEDTIFEKDIEEMTREELISTIEVLCKKINELSKK